MFYIDLSRQDVGHCCIFVHLSIKICGVHSNGPIRAQPHVFSIARQIIRSHCCCSSRLKTWDLIFFLRKGQNRVFGTCMKSNMEGTYRNVAQQDERILKKLLVQVAIRVYVLTQMRALNFIKNKGNISIRLVCCLVLINVNNKNERYALLYVGW